MHSGGYGSAGAGSSSHLSMELLKSVAGYSGGRSAEFAKSVGDESIEWGKIILTVGMQID